MPNAGYARNPKKFPQADPPVAGTTDYTDFTDSQTVDGRRAAVNNQCYPWPTLGQAVPSVVKYSAAGGCPWHLVFHGSSS
ncbi:MAG: hypothetical protein HYV36_09090 [Lentisphaerae bacterium]|nr:hypothetical protein [Lentisphaerota bacterium]